MVVGDANWLGQCCRKFLEAFCVNLQLIVVAVAFFILIFLYSLPVAMSKALNTLNTPVFEV